MNILQIVQGIIDRRLSETIEGHSPNSTESMFNKGQIEALSWVSAIIEAAIQAEKRE